MQRSKNDVWVGLFVLLGAAAILFLALKSANLLSMNFQTTYNVLATSNTSPIKSFEKIRSSKQKFIDSLWSGDCRGNDRCAGNRQHSLN